MDTRDGRIYNREQFEKMGEDDKKHMVQMNHGPSRHQRRKMRVGRNDPCPCGSGKKFKKCCLFKAVA